MRLRTALPALLALGAVLLAAGMAHAEATQHYSVLIQQQAAGHLTVTEGPDRRIVVDQTWRDNGRGPDIRETYTLDAAGVPQDYQGEGRSTFGAEIRERFSVQGGRLRWQSRVDAGDEAVAPGTLFLPLEGSFAYTADLVRALLRRPEGRAPVVGGHQLAAERLATTTVAGPDGPLPLVLVAITGADAQPWYLWLRDDASLRLHLVGWPGFAVVARGHEATADELIQRMLAAQDAWLAQLQQRHARALPGLTLIRGVRWFDAPAAVMRGPADVYLRAGLITAVTAPGALRDTRPDQVIDGTGRSLLPGLIDMHTHLWAGEAPLHLVHGVTAVRDLGNDNAELDRLQARLAARQLPGPKLYIAGFIEGKSAFSSRSGVVIDSLDAGLAAIDAYAARGIRQIKLYNSIQPAWVKPLAAHARARGMKVAGHVPAFMLAEQAVRDGYDELTHINQLMLNFVTRPGDDPRTLVRFTRVGDDAHRLDLTSPRARAFVQLLRTRGTVVDLTLATFEAMYTQAQGQPNPVLAPVAEQLPVTWRRGLKVAEMDLDGAKLATYRASWQRMLQLTRALHRAGVPLVAGTDNTAGFSLHHELALYVQAGLSPGEALRTATWTPAQVLGAGQERGRIAPGLAADLLLVEGDPSRRIGDLRRIGLVLQGGQAYAPDALFQAMGFKPVVPAAAIETSTPTTP